MAGTTSRQADRYAEQLGAEARERQEQLAKERFVCCGMPKATGHHEACHLFVPPETDEIDAGQTTLL